MESVGRPGGEGEVTGRKGNMTPVQFTDEVLSVIAGQHLEQELLPTAAEREGEARQPR